MHPPSSTRTLLDVTARALRPCALLALLTPSSGCGFLSAVANPKVAWAIQDPAPMSVVVRRADDAEATTREVERLLAATPTGPASDWIGKIGPDPKVAASEMKALMQEPMYKSSHSRVLASEVWVRTLPLVQSRGGAHPNLLSAIDPSLGDQYADLTTKKQEIITLAAQIDAERTAASAKDATPEDRQTHEEAANKLAKSRSDKEAALAPLEKAFVGAVRPKAALLPADQQTAYFPAVANLLQALDDADLANSAAAVRYPLALRSLPDSVKDMVPVLVADVLEERTGTRPVLASLRPEVSLQGTEVSLTLGGIDAHDLGGLSVADLTKEVVVRSGKWAVHALTLLATVDSTKRALSLEHDTLTEIMASWAAPPGGTNVLVVKIPAADSPAVIAATAAPRIPSSRARERRPVDSASLTSAPVKKAPHALMKPKAPSPSKVSPKKEPVEKGREPGSSK